MAELATDMWSPELVDDNVESGALVKTLSPTDEVVNGNAAEERFLGKKLKKKKEKKEKKKTKKEKCPSVNSQDTIFAEEPLAVEPTTATVDQEPLVAVPEELDILETAVPEADPVLEVESAHGPSSESPLSRHINGCKFAFSVSDMTLTPYSH
ncbi:hypothetical protein LB503_002139 [Fusarium chuoi]|nr:hypothetical protein LB503_002139 [Fusarium chuoi]